MKAQLSRLVYPVFTLAFPTLAVAQTADVTYVTQTSVPVLGIGGLMVMGLLLALSGFIWLKKRPNVFHKFTLTVMTSGLLLSAGTGGWLVSDAEAINSITNYLFSQHSSPVSVSNFPAVLTNDLASPATILSIEVSGCPGATAIDGTCAVDATLAENGGSCSLNSVCNTGAGCSALATFSVQMTSEIWICAYNNLTGKTWEQTYGVCNEAAGFHLASVGPMTRRGAPSDPEISAAMSAALANGHDYITTGHPARSCSWDSTLTSYESCNGLGYLNTQWDATSSGSNWTALTDGNTSDYRNWPSANATGVHPLASLCMNASGDPQSAVFDHRWR